MARYQAPQTMAEIREWVTGQDGGMQAKAANTVMLHLEHANLKRSFPEIRLDKHMTIEDVKDKLYTHTGTRQTYMVLALLDASTGEVKANMDVNDRKLGFYSPEDGDVIYITDMDPNSNSKDGWLDDVSLVKKYEMSEEDYDKRENSVRRAKQKEREAAKAKAEAEGTCGTGCCELTDEHLAEEASKMKVGDRVEVFLGGRRGTLQFVGKAPKLGPGYWVGVEYDEPVGKNNGTVKGVKYFECNEGFGGMTRPDKVSVGDFPNLLDEELGLDDEL